MFSMKIEGLAETQSKLTRMIVYSARDASKITQEYGNRFLELVKSNASGRPGPNIITGQYQDSIMPVEEGSFCFGAETHSPYGARLEFGFSGVDSAGRHYNQGAFPHWLPAKDEIEPQYLKAMQEAVRSWWR